MLSRNRMMLEYEENWDEWIHKIPDMTFRSDWKVKIIPPFGGALIRFRVTKGSKSISVFLDVFDNFALVGAPYFEAYPIDGWERRYGIEERDIKSMMDDIAKELEEQTEEKE